ncbi:MAG: PUA domain-containing protein, partial [Castellaniella sp.]|uniref:PUA domain-containing protein n=1 Tax=Castellaniella sp. TaxID=1955812 RepID=UPI003C78AC57
ANHLRLRGRVTLDAGAVRALTQGHRSLLPIGVIAVEGEFERGDVVACVDEHGVECGRGLINYSSADKARILRQPSTRIPEILGHLTDPELMHRDNMIVARPRAQS